MSEHNAIKKVENDIYLLFCKYSFLYKRISFSVLTDIMVILRSEALGSFLLAIAQPPPN